MLSNQQNKRPRYSTIAGNVETGKLENTIKSSDKRLHNPRDYGKTQDNDWLSIQARESVSNRKLRILNFE